jgi:hypothetical protein
MLNDYRFKSTGNSWGGNITKNKIEPVISLDSVLVFSTGGTVSEKALCNTLNVEIFKKPSSIKEWQSMVSFMASHRAANIVELHL